MTSARSTTVANAALVFLASALVVPPILMTIAVKAFGKRFIDLGPLMLVFWALFLLAFALGFIARDTAKGKVVLLASVLLPVVLIGLKLLVGMMGA